MGRQVRTPDGLDVEVFHEREVLGFVEADQQKACHGGLLFPLINFLFNPVLKQADKLDVRLRLSQLF